MKKWVIIGLAALAGIIGLTLFAGPGNIGKKALFYSGAVGILVAKIAGFVTASLAWPMIIILAVIGTITDPTPTNKG